MDPSFTPSESVLCKKPYLRLWFEDQEGRITRGRQTAEVRCPTPPSTRVAETIDWDYATSTALASEAPSSDVLAVSPRGFGLTFSLHLVASFNQVLFEHLILLLQFGGDNRRGNISE